MTLTTTLILALLAGLSIPVGALISTNTWFRTTCFEHEIDSFVSYFGGGALLAAIALVLVPFGMEHNDILSAAAAFLAGGVGFWQFGSWMKSKGGTASQFTGMLSDFVPESIALGAAAATGSKTGYLLAALVALQNMPEGFAAFHEMLTGGIPKRRLWPMFLTVPLVGPLAAWLGYACLSTSNYFLGLVMLFCSGGILYLIFEDIAPGSHLKYRNFPAIGAVSGFLLGMLGTMLIH
jgi:ZIP family zinc transporter